MRHFISLLSIALLTLQPLALQAGLFKIATVSPAGSSWMQTMQQAADTIATKTDGRVRLRFYPGGVMGNDSAVFRKMRIGQLQGAAIAGGSLSDVYTDAQAYSLPMLFDDYDEVDYVRERLDQRIIRGVDDGGLVIFGLGEGGFAYIMSDSPIRTPAELQQKKVWVPSSDETTQKIMTSFGISTIPLSLGDVLPSLQTGLIDTVATSPIAALALQWHTQIKYVTNLPIMYFYAVLAVDKKTFHRLSDNDQNVFRSEMEKAFQVIDRQNRADNRAALQAMQNQGIKLVEPGPEALAGWQEISRQAVQAQLKAGAVTQAMYQTLQAHLEAQRAQP